MHLPGNTRPSTLYLFCATALILSIIGIVFIYSSSSFLATTLRGCGSYFVRKQALALACGLIMCVCVSCIPLRVLRRLAFPAFIVGILLCCMPLIPIVGGSINGAARWIWLGPLSFQPVEFLKPAAILYFAHFLDKQRFRINQLWPFFISMIGLIALVLLLQPDFGQAVVLSVTAVFMLFIAECKLSVLVLLSSIFCAGGALLVLLKPYRMKRLLTFLNPWSDPQGAGFQIIQSLIAIANGKWFGRGIACSKQKFFYLPMQHTDFIFSIICEEIGIVGGITVIALYGLLLFSGALLALQQKSLFQFLVIAGSTLLITLQALINIGVSIGALPTKGIGLPFISYGNSSLIGMSLLVGIVIAVSSDRAQSICT